VGAPQSNLSRGVPMGKVQVIKNRADGGKRGLVESARPSRGGDMKYKTLQVRGK